MALAYADFQHILRIPKVRLPVLLQRLTLDPDRGMLDIRNAIRTQTEFLTEAFADRDIPAHPRPPLPLFSGSPDLCADLVKMISDLRQVVEERTPVEEMVYRAHMREAEFRRYIMANIAARKE